MKNSVNRTNGELPEAFLSRMQKILGDGFGDFLFADSFDDRDGKLPTIKSREGQQIEEG